MKIMVAPCTSIVASVVCHMWRCAAHGSPHASVVKAGSPLSSVVISTLRTLPIRGTIYHTS
jgi:hypothetical protein